MSGNSSNEVIELVYVNVRYNLGDADESSFIVRVILDLFQHLSCMYDGDVAIKRILLQIFLCSYVHKRVVSVVNVRLNYGQLLVIGDLRPWGYWL